MPEIKYPNVCMGKKNGSRKLIEVGGGEEEKINSL